MKEALVSKGLKVEIIESPIPVPQTGQVLIRVLACAANPKDWKTTYFLPPQNHGEDIAGYVESVGDGVLEFRPGDRVAALHEMFTPHGGYAEALQRFETPESVDHRRRPTRNWPYRDLRRWNSRRRFAVQLARKSGVHPILAVAGESKNYIETLVDHGNGDVVLDYRVGPEKLVAEIKEALAGRPLLSAFDAVGEHGSDKILGALLQPQNARLTITVPNDRTKISETHGVPFLSQFALPTMQGVPEGVESFWTALGAVFGSYKEFAYIFSRCLALGLKDGWLKPHRYELVPGGLDGIAAGLTNLQEGKAHGIKYVFRIADTKGLAESPKSVIACPSGIAVSSKRWNGVRMGLKCTYIAEKEVTRRRPSDEATLGGCVSEGTAQEELEGGGIKFAKLRHVNGGAEFGW
ncbi:hypothetical protein NM208_g6482 [Fusarium decemcellulare]|uniref:Uncharacterized protein n=1 Tax=Fusarium decemcellulare TaxID=57161 RepID=A0ACC1SCV8_9HYPO|nr:hypothetical protein NM208_g6482 [Fusarium decemcellulare]